MEPTDKERKRLAGSDILLSHLLSMEFERPDLPRRPDGATRIEIWETATPSHDLQVTLMEFDHAGLALRASIFDSLQTAQRWLGQT
jgi:hypothetical protein